MLETTLQSRPSTKAGETSVDEVLARTRNNVNTESATLRCTILTAMTLGTLCSSLFPREGSPVQHRGSFTEMCFSRIQSRQGFLGVGTGYEYSVPPEY